MRWYHFIAYFFGGAFLAIQCPILSMESRVTPFKVPLHHRPAKACPRQPSTPSRACSTLPSHLLICRVGSFQLRKTTHVLTLGAGVLIMSLMLAHTFGRLHGGL